MIQIITKEDLDGETIQVNEAGKVAAVFSAGSAGENEFDVIEANLSDTDTHYIERSNKVLKHKGTGLLVEAQLSQYIPRGPELEEQPIVKVDYAYAQNHNIVSEGGRDVIRVVFGVTSAHDGYRIATIERETSSVDEFNDYIEDESYEVYRRYLASGLRNPIKEGMISFRFPRLRQVINPQPVIYPTADAPRFTNDDLLQLNPWFKEEYLSYRISGYIDVTMVGVNQAGQTKEFTHRYQGDELRDFETSGWLNSWNEQVSTFDPLRTSEWTRQSIKIDTSHAVFLLMVEEDK